MRKHVSISKILAILAVLGALLVTGCSSNLAEKNDLAGKNNAVEKNEATAVTFTDDLGREVTVENPERVAALIGSFAEMWQLAGGDICATADDAWEDMGLTLAEDTVNLGQTKSINVEKLFEAEPDFIIASANTRVDVEIQDTLEATQIPTAYFEVSGFDDYLRVLKIFTDITGREDLYQKNGLEIQDQIDDVIAKSKERLQGQEGPSVLFLRVSATAVYAKNSHDSVLGEMLKALGCRNIADADESLLENVTLEHVLQMNPDYIFTVQIGGDPEGVQKHLDSLFAEDSAWATLTAVKEGRWYHMDKRLYNFKPNARWGEAYEGLEEILEEKRR